MACEATLSALEPVFCAHGIPLTFFLESGFFPSSLRFLSALFPSISEKMILKVGTWAFGERGLPSGSGLAMEGTPFLSLLGPVGSWALPARKEDVILLGRILMVIQQ